MIIGSVTGATFMGRMSIKAAAGYSYAFIWHGIFHTIGVALLWVVYLYWRSAGGDNFTSSRNSTSRTDDSFRCHQRM